MATNINSLERNFGQCYSWQPLTIRFRETQGKKGDNRFEALSWSVKRKRLKLRLHVLGKTQIGNRDVKIFQLAAQTMAPW
jgi:hypothetical protein